MKSLAIILLMALILCLTGCERTVERVVSDATWEAYLEESETRPSVTVESTYEPFVRSDVFYASNAPSVDAAMLELLEANGFSERRSEHRLPAGSVSSGDSKTELELILMVLVRDGDPYIGVFETRYDLQSSEVDIQYDILDIRSYADGGGVCRQMESWYTADLSIASDVCDRIAHLPPMAGLVLLNHGRSNMLMRKPLNVATDAFVQETLAQHAPTGAK